YTTPIPPSPTTFSMRYLPATTSPGERTLGAPPPSTAESCARRGLPGARWIAFIGGRRCMIGKRRFAGSLERARPSLFRDLASRVMPEGSMTPRLRRPGALVFLSERFILATMQGEPRQADGPQAEERKADANEAEPSSGTSGRG